MVGLRSDDYVDAGRPAGYFLAFGLSDATGNSNHRAGAIFSAQPSNIRIDFVYRLFPDVTGIEHHKIGLVAMFGDTHALIDEQFRHALTVIDVHLAAKRLDMEFSKIGFVHGSRLYNGFAAQGSRKRVGDPSPGLSSYIFAARIMVGVERLEEMNLDHETAPSGQQSPGVRLRTFIAGPTDFLSILTIVQKYWLHQYARRGWFEHFQQRRLERQQGRAVGCGTFRKNGDRPCFLQSIPQLVDLPGYTHAVRP